MGKIWIIEDDFAFSAALQRIITSEHEVAVFGEVPPDSDLLESEKPDMIFLDCMLPGETGLAFLQRMRQDERFSETAIVMMSTHYEMMEEAKALRGRYEEFLKKPCTARQIMALVHRHVKSQP